MTTHVIVWMVTVVKIAKHMIAIVEKQMELLAIFHSVTKKKTFNSCIDVDHRKRWCSFQAEYVSREWDVCERCAGVEQTCSHNPCQNNGTCVGFKNCIINYKCTCPNRYTGRHCETCVTQPCSANPCKNAGTCMAFDDCVDNYTCDCQAYAIGKNCETCVAQPCSSNPCQNGGKCIEFEECTDNYTCACPNGYSGKDCETCFALPCSNSPCQNEGTCIPLIGCIDNYTCNCQDGYSGKDCETYDCYCGVRDGHPCHFPFSYKKKTFNQCTDEDHERWWCSFEVEYMSRQWDDCEKCAGVEQVCSYNPCQNNGICTGLKNCIVNYKCTCRDRYTGRDCETCVAQPCSSNPCQNEGNCIADKDCVDDYTCDCTNGYSGKNCETHT